MKLEHGQSFTGIYKSKQIKGKVSINADGRVFFCQNVLEGSMATDKLGYKYSWFVGNGLSADYYRDIIGIEDIIFEGESLIKSSTPLSHIFGYSISPSGKTKIKFGCGAVTLHRTTIGKLIETALEEEKINKKIEAYKKKIEALEKAKEEARPTGIKILKERIWNSYRKDIFEIPVENLKRILLHK